VSSMPPVCNTELIAGEFARLRREKKARHRDIAGELAISEGELIAAHAGLSLADCLDRNDAVGFFQPLDDLFTTGPTHTNVNDFRALLVL